MIEKKTFIITIVVICIIFIAALVAEMFYYEGRIQAIEESKNIVLNIAANANNMQQNEKYDKNVLVDVSNIYFNNMYHLVKINYSNNEEEGYNYYCNIIKSNLEFIEENYKYNAIASELLKECYSNYYYELKDLKLSSKALNDFFTYIKIEKLKI